jgi:hypothetical protein
MLSGLRNLAKRIIRRRWYPILIPYFRIVDGAMSSRPRDLVEAMALCDGTRTLASVSKATGLPIAQLMAESEGEGPLVLWPMNRRLFFGEQRDGGGIGTILSPHLDDAALSLGSKMLWTTGSTVIDVFSRVSWWRYELSDQVLPIVQRARDAEEDLISRLTAWNVDRWELAEAPLRGYPLKEIFTAPRLPEAAAAHEAIRNRVREFAGYQNNSQRWFVPLGVGNHIDHRIARDAALDGLRDAGVRAGQVEFYEDLPYAAQQPGLQDFSDFLSAVVPAARLTVAREYDAHPLKRRLLRTYHSQLTPSQIESVYEYACRVRPGRPCERLWHFDDATLARHNHQIPPLGPLV